MLKNNIKLTAFYVKESCFSPCRYEDFQCWLSSGERGPQSSPVTPHRNPVTPQPSPVSSEGDEPGQGRKVSFFDDVTVYVFDQVTASIIQIIGILHQSHVFMPTVSTSFHFEHAP